MSDESYAPALREAIQQRDERHLRDILSRIPEKDRAVQVNETDLYGQTPLIAATATNHIGLVDALLASGADPNLRNDTKSMTATPLMSAVCVTDTAITEHLLNAGARLNDQLPENGWSALHYASFKGTPATVKLLLERGADATLVDRRGHTAEHEAQGEKLQILTAHRERPLLRQVVGLPTNLNADQPRARRRM